MKKLLKLLNHELTEAQLKELKDKWGVTEIVQLDPEKAKLFGAVTLENYNDVIDTLDREIKSVKPDLMFIQGQAGVVHNLINRNPEITPLFAMTQRKSVDKKNEDGTVTKVSVFEHQAFMKY